MTTAFVKRPPRRRQRAEAADPGHATYPPPPLLPRAPFAQTTAARATRPSKVFPVRPSLPLWSLPKIPPVSVSCYRPRKGLADRWRGKTRRRTAEERRSATRTQPTWPFWASDWLSGSCHPLTHHFLAARQEHFGSRVLMFFISEQREWDKVVEMSISEL